MKTWNEIGPRAKLRRWQEVLRVLNGLDEHEREKHFNMAGWGTQTPCGTIACAAGHCAMDPWFRKRGFRMDFAVPIKDKDGKPYIDPETGEVVLRFHISSVDDFFGMYGSRIFWNYTLRPVEKVIQEVEDYIENLKAGGQ